MRFLKSFLRGMERHYEDVAEENQVKRFSRLKTEFEVSDLAASRAKAVEERVAKATAELQRIQQAATDASKARQIAVEQEEIQLLELKMRKLALQQEFEAQENAYLASLQSAVADEEPEQVEEEAAAAGATP